MGGKCLAPERSRQPRIQSVLHPLVKSTEPYAPTPAFKNTEILKSRLSYKPCHNQSLRSMLSTRSPSGPQKSLPVARLCSSMKSTYCLKLVLRCGSRPSSRMTG